MKRLFIFAAAAAVAAASIGGGAGAQSGEARVRVLHASPDAPAVDVYVDGAEAISDLAYPDITDYVSLPAGDHDIAVYPASADGSGDPVIAASVTLEAGTDYTVAAVGALADIAPLVLVDDNTAPAAGTAHLRFVHASPDAPAVDIAAEGAGVVVPNASFTDASDYLPLPAGTYDLSVLVAGTDTVALDLPGIELEPGVVYTAFAIGFAEGEPALTAKLTTDAAASQAPEPTAQPTAQPTPTQGTAPVPPHTGTGLATDNGGISTLWVAVAATLIIVGAGTGTLALRKARVTER